MKKILCLTMLGMLICIHSKSQVASYTFSQSTATYTEITGGTVLGDATTDEQRFVDPAVPLGGTALVGAGLPIGFSFIYNTKTYDVFGVNANGWITLGQSTATPNPVDITSSSYTAPISATSTSPAALQDRIAGFARNIIAQTGAELRYETIGSAPSRTLVVQWKNYKRTTGGAIDTLNFQIRLNETTNIVELVYGKVLVSSNSTCQVGLRGDANTDYFNRTTTTDWSTTTAGAANNVTMTLSTTIFPASGLSYTFTPPIVYQYDAGLTAITSPSTPVVLGNNKVAVTVKNFGTSSLTAATIGWSVNGILQTPSNFTNTGLAQFATTGPDTIGTYNFATAGSYIIKAWTYNPNGNSDGNNVNDTITKTVYAQGYAPLPFSESFNGTWISVMNTREVPSVYWINTPNTGNNSWRRNDDGAAASWTNATNGAYTPTGVGTGTLYSARFHSRSATAGSTGTLDAYLDFSTVGSKMLKFWHINTSGTDTLSVLLSNDGGSTYSLIQKFATVAAWTQHFVSLGTSTAPNSIVRFSVTNSTTGTTDLGIDSVQVIVLPANDAGITAINAPTTPVTQGSNPVTVTIMNYGASSLTSASIGWSVNAITQTASPYTNAGLITGATDGPVAIGNYNFSSPGFYTIKAWSSLPNGNTDADHSNDTISKTVYIQAYATIPFIEGFDSTWINKNSTKDVPSDYWSNNPATGNNSWRRNDDSLSAAWTNSTGGNNGYYAPAGANGTIHSARFHTWDAQAGTTGDMDLFLNFTPSGNKLLDFWYINADGTDSVSIYMSTDGGTTFTFIQKLLTAATWTHYNINIGGSTSPNCVIRFKSVSDYGNTDMGLDQVQVFLQPANDLAAIAWVTPVSGCGLSNAEHVTVKVKNAGLSAQSNIPVKYSINGGTSFVGPEVITGPVNPGDTVTYTFTAASNFTTAGLYPCELVVKFSGDAIASNDTVFATLNSLVAISGNPFSDSLDAGNKHYLFTNSTNSSASLAVGSGNQNTDGFDMTGGIAGTWPSGTSTTTTAQQAFSYTDHVATIQTCSVDATTYPANKLYLRFDLKQTYSTGKKYSYFMVLINGTDTISDITGTKFFNPTTASGDAFASRLFNLGAYAGTSFSMELKSACKYNDANATSGIGDHAYIDNIALFAPPVINDLGPDTSICQGNSLILNAGSGTGYTYLWTVLPAGNTVGTAQTLIVDSTGTYQVVVTNSSGFSAGDAITVTIVPAPVVNAGTDTTINYLTTATLHGSATPGTGTYTYLWSPAASLVDATIQNPTTTSLALSTIYTLTVTNTTTGCTGTDQVTVFVVGGPLSVAASATPSTICAGDSTSLLALPSGGSGIYTYHWLPSAGLSNDTIANPNASPAITTTYTITLSDGASTSSASVTVNVNPLPVVNLGADTTICKNKTITLNAGTGATSYLWSTGETTQTISVDSTDAISNIATIWVSVMNSSSCSAIDTIVVTFDPCTGLTDLSNNTSVTIYPNPTTGIATIVVKGLISVSDLEIYTLQGQMIYSEKVNGNSSALIDMTSQPKGLYIVKLINSKTSIFSKLLIQ
jgi:hypothetical protein